MDIKPNFFFNSENNLQKQKLSFLSCTVFLFSVSKEVEEWITFGRNFYLGEKSLENVFLFLEV